jgi:hypothetical protein
MYKIHKALRGMPVQEHIETKIKKQSEVYISMEIR